MVLTHNKKILIVSNNPLSNTNNNGKTVYSYFKQYPESLLGQLFIENSFPDFNSDINFYNVTDKDNLDCVLRRKKECGNIVNQEDLMFCKIHDKFIKKQNIKKNIMTLFIREYIWKCNKWKNETLDQWLDNFKPDIIFFYAGDTLFMYDIVNYIKIRYNCKLAIYISDDYILHRSTISVLKHLRRALIYKKMKKSVLSSDYFFTISPEMKEVYKKTLGKDSYNIMNAPVKVNDEKSEIEYCEYLKLLYCGGLEYGRADTLIYLSNAIQIFNNKSSRRKAFLEIYSLDEINVKKKMLLNNQNHSAFLGSIDSDKVKEKISDSNIVVHVESFDKKNIENTRLSISTKITDYLCANKPILAIGPEGISSMNFLLDSAFCITNEKEISIELVEFLSNYDMVHKELVNKARVKYEYIKLNYSSDKVVSIITD